VFRIIHIIPGLNRGGAERLVLDIVSELNKKPGIEVRLIIFSNSNDYLKEYPFIHPVFIPSTVTASVFGKWKYDVEALSKFIKSFQPDVIHTHLFETEFVTRAINYPEAKWFSHCHNNMVQFENLTLKFFFDKKKLAGFYEKRYLFKRYKVNGGNHFIAISKDTQKYFEKRAKPFSLTLLPNAIDFHRFYKIKKTDVGQGPLKLINVGSLVDNKNQSFLIDVVNVLRNKHIEVELDLLGEGRNRPEIENKIKKNQLENQVILHGNVDQVQEFLWKADIYVHSALSEALGLTIIEAMGAGLPVVTLDGKGNRDLIEEGKNGYLLNNQNAEAFADKIIELWNDQEKYWEMSRYAQEYAKHYDIKQYVDSLIKIYSA